MISSVRTKKSNLENCQCWIINLQGIGFLFVLCLNMSPGSREKHLFSVILQYNNLQTSRSFPAPVYEQCKWIIKRWCRYSNSDAVPNRLIGTEIVSSRLMQVWALSAIYWARTAAKPESNSWTPITHLPRSAISLTEKFMEQMGKRCSWPYVPVTFRKQIQVNVSQEFLTEALGSCKNIKWPCWRGFLNLEMKPSWMRLKITLVTVIDVAFVHLIHLTENQDDVIRASGAPSESKLRVPHMGLGIGEFLAGIVTSWWER